VDISVSFQSGQSGREAWDVNDFQLYAVRVVEKHRVVPGHVRVLLRAALDLGAASTQPLGALVDREPRRRLQREVVQTDPVAVVLVRRRLRLSQADRAARAGEVPDRLPALALDLADAIPPERLQQLAVEGQAAQDRGDDEIDVVDAC
jgi:hypothetical protein